MREDVVSRDPEEACGLLAGNFLADGIKINSVFQMTNILHSPTIFRCDPREQFETFGSMEAKGLEMVGIYHSHPEGPCFPSATDREEANYPDIVHIIWSKAGVEWVFRAFIIEQTKIQEVCILISED